jgi:hypothetical protein
MTRLSLVQKEHVAALALPLLFVPTVAFGQTGPVGLNPGYSDWNAPANVSGTYTDQSPGSYATVTNAASVIIHARIGWPSPGLNNYVPVSVRNPDGTMQTLDNYNNWQVWTDPSGTPYIVIVSYPFQAGQTLFMVNGAAPPTPSASSKRGQITLTWSPPSNIVGYQLSWGLTNGGPYPNVVNVGLSYLWTLTGLPSGQTVFATVQSSDAAGNRSCDSNQLQFTVP